MKKALLAIVNLPGTLPSQMKSILKLSALAILLTVASCAHHGKCHGDNDKSQCSMKDGKKECCKDKE